MDKRLERLERARLRSEARANQMKADLEQRSQALIATAEATKQAAKALHEHKMTTMIKQRDKALDRLEEVLPKCEQCKKILLRCTCKNKNLDK